MLKIEALKLQQYDSLGSERVLIEAIILFVQTNHPTSKLYCSSCAELVRSEMQLVREVNGVEYFMCHACGVRLSLIESNCVYFQSLFQWHPTIQELVFSGLGIDNNAAIQHRLLYTWPR